MSCPIGDAAAFDDADASASRHVSSGAAVQWLSAHRLAAGSTDLVQDWMLGDDRAGYATGVALSWIIVTGLLCVWVAVLLAGPHRWANRRRRPNCRRCCASVTDQGGATAPPAPEVAAEATPVGVAGEVAGDATSGPNHPLTMEPNNGTGLVIDGREENAPPPPVEKGPPPCDARSDDVDSTGATATFPPLRQNQRRQPSSSSSSSLLVAHPPPRRLPRTGLTASSQTKDGHDDDDEEESEDISQERLLRMSLHSEDESVLLAPPPTVKSTSATDRRGDDDDGNDASAHRVGQNVSSGGDGEELSIEEENGNDSGGGVDYMPQPSSGLRAAAIGCVFRPRESPDDAFCDGSVATSFGHVDDESSQYLSYCLEDYRNHSGGDGTTGDSIDLLGESGDKVWKERGSKDGADADTTTADSEVYLQDDDELSVDGSSPTDDDDGNDGPAFAYLRSLHLSLNPSSDRLTNVSHSHVTTPLDTSFPHLLLEDGFLFFHDDEDEDAIPSVEEATTSTPPESILSATNNDSQPPKRTSPARPPTEGAEPEPAAAADDTATLRHSKYSSHAASRKRALEDYVRTLAKIPPPDPFPGPGNGAAIATDRAPPQDGAVLSPISQEVNRWMSRVFRAVSPSQSGTPDTSPTHSGGGHAESAAPDGAGRRGRQAQHPDVVPGPEQRREPRRADDDRRLRRCRGAAAIWCTLLIVSTLLFGMNGVWNLQIQSQNVQASWQDLQNQVAVVEESLYEIQSLQAAAFQQTWDLWQLLDGHCPEVRPHICLDNPYASSSGIETTVVAGAGNNSVVVCQLDGLPFEDVWAGWVAAFQPSAVADLSTQGGWIARAEDEAAEFWSSQDDAVQEGLGAWNWTLWIALASNICLSFIAFGILWVISIPTSHDEADESGDSQRGAPGRERRTRMDPPFSNCTPFGFSLLFWALIFTAWIFGGWFSISTILTLDMCGTEKPNEVAQQIVERWVDEHADGVAGAGSVLMGFWKYHLEECPSGEFPPLLGNYIQDWSGMLEPTSELAQALQSLPIVAYEEACNQSMVPMVNSAMTLNAQLCSITRSLSNLNRHMGCDQWLPSYQAMVQDAICTEGSEALVWVTATQLAILVFCFLLWTCRTTFLPRPKNYHESGSACCTRWCCRTRRSSSSRIALPWRRKKEDQAALMSKNHSTSGEDYYGSNSSENEENSNHLSRHRVQRSEGTRDGKRWYMNRPHQCSF